ncbi:MAG: SET domain-containing protein [Candidatus Gastranaerophilales bacterium]|nr:SET domain-containing protein [Candidatus Gastranaerophilales bacterium]
MQVSFSLYSKYNAPNIIPFKQSLLEDYKKQTPKQDPLEGDKLVISTPKEGLVKQNSFLHPNLKLKYKSNGERGVFATGEVKKGEIVCIFVGDIFTADELKKLPEDLQRKTLQLAPDIYQLASKNPNDTKAFDAAEYFNHSCEPNLFLTGNNILIAGRDIKPSEELTFDYGTSDTLGNPDIGWKCDCGATNCRGENTPDAYRGIIAKLSEKYGQERALDLVANYIKQMYLDEQ